MTSSPRFLARPSVWLLALPTALLAAGVLVPLAELALVVVREAREAASYLTAYNLRAVTNTLWMGAAVAAAATVLGFVVAYAVTLARPIGRGPLKVLFMAPLFAPSIMPAIGLIYLAGGNGLVVSLDLYGPLGVFLAGVVFALPHAVMQTRLNLSGLDFRLIAAARSLGAGPVRRFVTVTLVHPRFIGKSNTAYTALGFLQTKVFVLTTPGIDVLQIRRSPGVRRYVHVVHAVGDIHTYKLFSFDYYDAVYCSGPGQVASLRALEAIRGTRPKALSEVGCAYLDGLVARAASAPEPGEKTVIVAPTWGRNGLLTRTGARIPKMLAQAGYDVILRPHPQSFVSEPELMEKLAQELSEFKNVRWDRNPDGFASLSQARLMVSDISGVIFDFAFVFLRPVVSVGAGPLKDGFEAWEIPHEAWEMSALDTLGRRVLPGHEDEVLGAVQSLLADPQTARGRIAELRNANVVNFGCAGMPIARALADELTKLENGRSAAR